MFLNQDPCKPFFYIKVHLYYTCFYLPWASTVKKKFGADYEQLLRAVFSCFHGQKINLNFFWKYCSVLTKKLHRIKVKKYFLKIWEEFYFHIFIGWCGISNFNVNTKTLWSFPNSGITKVAVMKKAFLWHYELVFYGGMKS